MRLPPSVEPMLSLFVVEDLVIVEERARLLRNGFEFGDRRRERRAVRRVAVRGGDDVFSGLVDRSVDVVGRHVDVPAAVDGAVGVHENEVVDGHVAKRHAVTAQPEAIRLLGIARRDVPVAE